MKTQQWQLRKATEPRSTLADVESSREKPVLCWCDEWRACQCFVEDGLVHRVSHTGVVEPRRSFQPKDYPLYTQPSRLMKLEDVPDRRVIYAGAIIGGTKQGWKSLFFRDKNTWFEPERCGWEHTETKPDPDDWQLTDHCVELVETEIGVM